MFEISLFKEFLNKLKEKSKKPYKVSLKQFAPSILQKSLKLRVIDSWDDEWTMAELYALEWPNYSVQAYWIDFVASPKHSDWIVIVGAIPQNMQQAVLDAYKIIAEPKIVIACWDKAINWDKRFTNCLWAKDLLKVDLEIPWNPPSAIDIFSYLASYTKKI